MPDSAGQGNKKHRHILRIAMKSFATLLALGLVCGAAADEDDAPGSATVACVATPAQFVANLNEST